MKVAVEGKGGGAREEAKGQTIGEDFRKGAYSSLLPLYSRHQVWPNKNILQNIQKCSTLLRFIKRNKLIFTVDLDNNICLQDFLDTIAPLRVNACLKWTLSSCCWNHYSPPKLLDISHNASRNLEYDASRSTLQLFPSSHFILNYLYSK